MESVIKDGTAMTDSINLIIVERATPNAIGLHEQSAELLTDDHRQIGRVMEVNQDDATGMAYVTLSIPYDRITVVQGEAVCVDEGCNVCASDDGICTA